jgi:hypothetical protein
MGLVEVKLRVDSENTELHSAFQYLSGEDWVSPEAISTFTEAVQASELTKRNLSLEIWTKERMEDAETWHPTEVGFSPYLETQTQLAMSALRKSQALKVRLSKEVSEQQMKRPKMTKEMKTLRAKVSADLMEDEQEAQQLGVEVLAEVKAKLQK